MGKRKQRIMKGSPDWPFHQGGIPGVCSRSGDYRSEKPYIIKEIDKDKKLEKRRARNGSGVTTSWSGEGRSSWSEMNLLGACQKVGVRGKEAS